MRIALRLLPKQQVTKISLNYQYPLSAAIYKILRRASPVYADFLHDQGYAAPSGRLMRLFTFSRLSNPGARRRNAILVARAGKWYLQVAAPCWRNLY